MALPITLRDGVAYFEADAGESGNRPTIALLHGLGNSLDFWTAVAPSIGRVFRTIAIDIPGFGRSRRFHEFTLDEVAERTLTFYRARDVTDCVLVAHSMGAFLALRLAALAPALVRRLILVDGTLGRAIRAIRHPATALRDIPLGISVLSQFVGGTVPVTPRTARWIGHSALVRQVALWPYVASPRDLDPRLVGDALAHNGGFTVVKTLIQARRLDYEDLMSGVTQPVDLVWGKADRLLNERDVAEARSLVDVRRELAIDGCGHWPMIEKPELLADVILSWSDNDRL